MKLEQMLVLGDSGNSTEGAFFDVKVSNLTAQTYNMNKSVSSTLSMLEKDKKRKYNQYAIGRPWYLHTFDFRCK